MQIFKRKHCKRSPKNAASWE